MKTAREGYVAIKTLPHYGEKAVPIGKTRLREDGETEREFILLGCQHGVGRVWLTRKDI